MPVWNDKMTGHQAGSGQVSLNSVSTWSLLLSSAYQFCSSNVWVRQHHSVHALDRSLGLLYKWNQLMSNNPRLTCYIQKGLHAGKWPDLMTPKPNAPSTLGYHWNHTGWCYRPVVFQWQPNVNLHNWNTLEDHWSHKYTGIPLEPYWLMLAPSGIPVAIKC